VAPRARHINFLLAGVEAWLERLPADLGMWIAMGIGRKVVDWLEAAIAEQPALLGRVHSQRDRIDRVLGRLVSIGVAEAHELEKRIDQATAVGPDISFQRR